MDDFPRRYNKIKRAFDKHRFAEALRQLAALDPARVPENEAWRVPLARGMALAEVGRGAEGVAALEEALGSPYMPLETKRHVYSNYLMELHYLQDLPDEKLRRAHFAYADFFADVRPYAHARARRGEKLRVGYLSPNLTDHIVLSFAIQLFAQYDRDRYEVILYSMGSRQNEVTDWVAGFANGFRDLSRLAPARAAQQIFEDEVDVLVDLSGHCEGGRTLEVAAYRPAPVQLCGIGYFDTTGLPAMDAFLGDVCCDPDGADAQFCEKLLRLPKSHFCFTPTEQFAHFSGAYRLHDPIVFGSFNNFAKITDEMLLAWREILARVPKSRLLLKNVKTYREPLAAMRKRMEALGFPMERITLRPATQHYLKDYLGVDVILDTYPYVGGGTTCEALYMGVPVVTRYGTRHGSRFGLSLLQNIGIGELAAPTVAEYIERAVMLAEDPNLVAALHARLRQMMEASPVMDGKGYTRAVEAAFEMLWEDWLSQ